MKSIYTFSMFFICISFWGQNGQIDTNFGTNGLKKVVTNLYGYQSTPNPPSVDRVIFGSTTERVYLTNDITSKGVTILGSSNTVGFQFPDFISGWEKVMRFNDALFDTNQYIYMTGYTSKEDDNKAFFAARLKRGTGSTVNNWTLDSGFNVDGKLVFDTPEINEEAVAIKLAANGKVFITGYSGNKGIIVKYTSEGFLDKTFNQSGFYTFQIGTNCKPTSMVVQPDGKAVVAGNSFNGVDTDFFLIRLNIDGTVDNTFGTNGIVIKDVANRDNTGNTLALAADGSLLVGGKAYTVADTFGCQNVLGYNACVFRYNSEGQLMTSYTNGYIAGAYVFSGCYFVGTQRFAIGSEITSMFYKDGWLYGIGRQEKYNSTDLTIRPIALQIDTTNGNLPFNLNIPSANYSMEPVSIDIRPSDNNFYLSIKYKNCTVGQTPFLKMPTNNYPTACNSTSELSISFKKIVKTSTGYYGLDLNKKLFKMDDNFNLDTNFASNGYIYDVMNFNVDANDKIICNLGEGNTGSTKFVLARYNTNGKPDASFGFYGTYPTAPYRYVNGITVMPTNEYLINKTSAESGINILSVSKMNNAGQLDTSFGTGGRLNLVSIPTISSSFSALFAAEDLVKDSAGNYYALAYHLAGGNGPAFTKIFKFSANGVIDNSFGTNGMVDITPNITLDTSHKVNIVINNVGGKLLVHNKNNLLQFNLDGTIDTGFGVNGLYDVNLVIADFTTNRILVKGSDYFIGGKDISSSKSNIVKINSAGILDTSFGTNAGFFQETSISNPNYVHLRDMFFHDANSILYYQNGIKKIN